MSRVRALPVLCLAVLSAASGVARAENPVALEGVDRDLADAIASVLPDREPPDSRFAAERLSDEAAARVRAYLRSEGYYAAAIEPDADATPIARVLISLGPRFTFAAPILEIEGPAPEPAAKTALDEAIAIVTAGAPARAADIIGAEQAGLQALRRGGYPDAAIGERRVIVDHATQRVNAVLTFTAGAPALLGRVRSTPDDVISDNLAQRLAPWTPGDPYAPDQLTQLRRNAARTGAFANVATALAPETSAEGRRDVILTLEPLERRTIEIGGGYSTTEGLGGDIEWSRRNLWRMAETLTLGLTLSELRQTARAELALPNDAALATTTHYAVQAVREDAGPYDRNALSVSWSIDAEPRQVFGLSYGASLSAEFYDAAAGVQNAYILSAFGDVRRDTTDQPLNAHNGHILQLRIEPAVSTGDATLAFARFLGDARYYQTPDFAESITFAARARAGYVTALGGDNADLPLDRLFYAGGGGSVRGYAYNSIFPNNPLLLTEPAGGRALIETSIEARMRIGESWGAAAFIDGGAAFDDEIDMRWGAGIGLRYDLGFAPLRVDFAVPLDRRDSDDEYAIYVSVGQAF